MMMVMMMILMMMIVMMMINDDDDGDDDELCWRQLEASQSAKFPLSHHNHTFDPLTSASDHQPR